MKLEFEKDREWVSTKDAIVRFHNPIKEVTQTIYFLGLTQF